MRKLYIERAYNALPIYTADVSGVCSALYELGGMTVIHDPSGCNSTYNTHDETRWYDRDSLIFISGLTEIDAVMGNDEKFTADVVQAAQQLHPAFIALVCSPIPYMNGTDFPALARLIEAQTGIPAFHVPANGMHDYICGAGQAYRQLAERILLPRETHTGACRVNILGMTPLDFAAPSSPASLRAVLRSQGFEIQSCWAMGDTLDALRTASSADVSLVVSAAGLPAAEYMYETYHIPWAVGLPLPGLEKYTADALRQSASDGLCRRVYEPLREGMVREDAPAVFIGEAVCMQSLAALYTLRTKSPARVLCPLEQSESLLLAGDAYVYGEQACAQALQGAQLVTADPFYAEILPAGCDLFSLPQLAFSGRNHLREIPDIFTEAISWD